MTKTISIDKEAYDILKSHKVDPKETFSQVIKKSMMHADDWEGLKRRFGWREKKKHAPARR